MDKYFLSMGTLINICKNNYGDISLLYPVVRLTIMNLSNSDEMFLMCMTIPQDIIHLIISFFLIILLILHVLVIAFNGIIRMLFMLVGSCTNKPSMLTINPNAFLTTSLIFSLYHDPISYPYLLT